MAFETFDLGRVYQTAEGIKNMRRQEKTDALRDQYLQSNIQGAQQQQTLQKQEADAESQARQARSHYLAAQAVESAADPIAAAREFAPEMIAAFEQQHGPGTFGQLPADAVKKIAGMGKEKSAAAAGINLRPSPDMLAQQQFTREMDQTNFGQQQQIARQQHGYRMQELDTRVDAKPGQLITRPVGNGMVQDFLFDAQSNSRIPSGEPYQPASQTKLREIPAATAKGIIENRANLSKLDAAIAAVEANPDAFGTQNYAPDFVTQRLSGKAYSGGTDTRAKVADIGSLTLHDRSGAAVSAAEFPRLAPFIPQATDTAQTVLTKLRNMRANLETLSDETESLYTPDAGYQPIPTGNQGGQPKGGASRGGPTVGTVEDGYRFKGGNPADPNSWEKAR